ncbi:hypothetical protein ACFU5O_18035 [Streptomyces sp. NPDC057445]|uniref:hypothetical protein n=1 Tax=Streptomyces sp. NPDC057445 TaxID=3346136 RepID=UPI00367BF8E4
MTPRRRLSGTGAAMCIGVLSAILVTGCTEGSGSSERPTKRVTPPTSSQPERHSPGATDRKLGEQAEAALDTVTIDDPEFVESGLEALGDGIHTNSPLTRGKSYQLAVACAGRGKARLSVRIKDQPAVQSFDCDGTAVHQRIAAAPSRLRIDVDGEPGSSGMVAWRISEAAQ